MVANYIQARDTVVEAKISSGERVGHMGSRIAVQRGKVFGKESPMSVYLFCKLPALWYPGPSRVSKR